ncbi:hypothetical protein ACFFRR_009870 [Megaselia abdita]
MFFKCIIGAMIVNVNLTSVITVATAIIIAITTRITNTIKCNSGFRYLILIILVVTQTKSSESLSVRQLDVDDKLNADTSRITNLTRQHNGDVFSSNGVSHCTSDICVGLSSGTAGQLIYNNEKTGRSEIGRSKIIESSCTCQCLPYLKTYREDLGICVDDVHECTLSTFTSGSSSEKIPYVFLPLRGQIIHPSREIHFADMRTPVCAVTGSQYLTTNGWTELRNPIDTDFPFRIFRDEGRSFLQWLGEPDLRNRMQGRLVLIHLMCRDMAMPSVNNASDYGSWARKRILSPCVAFRINGNPVNHHNVTEISFQSDSSATLAATFESMHTKEYIVIGICSLILGLIYVATVFLYIHIKKKKNKIKSENSKSRGDPNSGELGYSKNDQVTFGNGFVRNDSVYSLSSLVEQKGNQPLTRRNSSIIKEEMGIVKDNPLLKHFPNLNDHSGFASDLSNSNSECEDKIDGKSKNIQTSVTVHPVNEFHSGTSVDNSPSPSQDNECIPQENVSIVEDMCNEDKLDALRALANSTTIRKKLFFNPAYFEPHLLMSPPPAAIEFLSKIREVIAIAKYKMATKRYTPTLNIIVEENSTMNSGNLKIKRTNSQVSGTESSSCKRCSPSQLNGPVENGTKNCDNCGDKRKGIQKWLESVPTHVQEKQKNSEESKNLPLQIQKTNQLKKKSISPPKTKPPPPPVGKNIQALKQTPSTKQEIPTLVKPTSDISLSTNVKSSKTTSPKPKPESISSQKEDYYTFGNIGSDIYNNPKFSLIDSPANSQRSKISSQSQKSKIKQNICDQYSNYYFDKGEKCHYDDIIRNIKQMPDMVYEALTRDYSLQKYQKSNVLLYRIPTPDYDSTIEKNNKEIYNSGTHSSAPSVPTPDYSTLSLGRKYQPDSPIYRRKSPQYLIVDYETDSLERSSTNRKRSTSSSNSPSSNNSSEVSSQPSPSLSTALPLEEEVEIHHTIYDKVDGFRKDGDCSGRKILQIDETPKSKEMEARIKYDTPYMGSMTIEVEHEPQSDFEISTDSDQYEPDTLDRKPKKHSFCDVQNLNAAWTEHLTKSQKFVNCHDDRVSYSSLENMNSLPDFTTLDKECPKGSQLILRSANSFRSTISPSLSTSEKQTSLESKPLFGSLREIYQSKVLINSRPKLSSVNFSSTVFQNTSIPDADEQGKMLTLEAKHSRRQRSFFKEQKCMPPDVIPPAKFMESTNNSKNLNGWNTDNFSGEDTIGETTSNHSESTEFTGVSDNQEQNSDFEEIKLRNSTKILNEKTYSAMTIGSPTSTVESQINNKLSNLRNDYSFNKYISRKKNTESDSNRHLSEMETNNNCHLPTPPPPPQTLNQYSTGMQIAIGIRDRAKKNKDIKNAWKKIVSIATSKFSPNSSPTITPNHTLSFEMINDEKIPALIDDKYFTCLEIPSQPMKVNELDSGYLSIEDSIDIYNRRLFDRFNYSSKMDVKSSITEEDTISPSCNGGSETEEDEELDDGALGEDMCESGAESIETNSVLYKHTRR